MGTAWLQQISIDRWARGVTALMAVAVAWSLAQLTWLVLPGGASEVGRAAPAPQQIRQARSTPRLAPVAELSLFGQVEQVLAAGGGPVDAPETRLNLTLRGVLATGSPVARAIISAGGSEERSYRVGDSLPGGATLDQVLADRIILQRAGRFEALYLPKDKEPVTISSVVQPSSNRAQTSSNRGQTSSNQGGSVRRPAVSASDTGAQLQEMRARIMEDPTQAFSLARVQPVMEGGKLKGYRLSPSKEKELFRQLGLRPGDVVTSVNGISLDDPARVGEVLSLLTSSGQIVLTLDRNGRQETVVVPFQ